MAYFNLIPKMKHAYPYGCVCGFAGIRFEASLIVIVGALTLPFRKTTGQFIVVFHDERLARECKLIR